MNSASAKMQANSDDGNKLWRLEPSGSGQERKENRTHAKTLIRWCKFNAVGGAGIVVQFAVLFLLKSLLHFHYLVATAVAVETAVLHNFVWHERFTWVDRTWVDRNWVDRNWADRSWSDRMRWGKPERERARPARRATVIRLARFHAANGAISIGGNLGLMKVLVGLGHMNYLAANAVAIAICSVANFFVSDGWVFGEK